jgi:hypothetical protein
MRPAGSIDCIPWSPQMEMTATRDINGPHLPGPQRLNARPPTEAATSPRSRSHKRPAAIFVLRSMGSALDHLRNHLCHASFRAGDGIKHAAGLVNDNADRTCPRGGAQQ